MIKKTLNHTVKLENGIFFGNLGIFPKLRSDNETQFILISMAPEFHVEKAWECFFGGLYFVYTAVKTFC